MEDRNQPNQNKRDLPDNDTRELGRAITFLSRSRKRFMSERLRDYGFSGAMYMILLHIERHPGTTQDNIANHMFIDKCNVARRTKKLEALGYLYPVSYTHLDVYKRQGVGGVQAHLAVGVVVPLVIGVALVKLVVGCLLYTSRCV